MPPLLLLLLLVLPAVADGSSLDREARIERPERWKRDLTAKPDSESFALKAVENLLAAIKTNDQATIEKYIPWAFEYDRCGVKFGQAHILKLVRNLENRNSIKFELWKNETYEIPIYIRFIATTTNLFRKDPLKVEYFLRREGYFDIIRILSCDKPNSLAGFERTSRRFAETISNEAVSLFHAFLSNLNHDVITRDATAIASHFDANFVFHGCKGSMNRGEFVRSITVFPSQFTVTYKFVFARSLDGDSVLATIVKMVLADSQGSKEIEKRFVFNARSNTIQAGSQPNCDGLE